MPPTISDPEFSEESPGVAPAHLLVLSQLLELGGCIEAGLPGFAADDDHSVNAVAERMNANNVDVGCHRVLLLDVVGVIRPRPEPDVVHREVASQLKMVLDDLFEHVLFHGVSWIALMTDRTVAAADAAS